MLMKVDDADEISNFDDMQSMKDHRAILQSSTAAEDTKEPLLVCKFSCKNYVVIKDVSNFT